MSQGALQALGAFSGGMAQTLQPGLQQSAAFGQRRREREEETKIRAKEREEDIGREDRRFQLADLARQEQALQQTRQFDLTRVDRQAEQAQQDWNTLLQEDRLKNQIKSETLHRQQQFGLLREESEARRSEADTARKRQEKQDMVSLMRLDTETRQAEIEEGRKKEEHQAKMTEILTERANKRQDTILAAKMSADAAARESADRIEQITGPLPLKFVAETLQTWATKSDLGMLLETQVEPLKHAMRFIRSVGARVNKAADTGDAAFMTEIEVRLASAANQAIEHYKTTGDFAAAKKMMDSALALADVELSRAGGGMVKQPPGEEIDQSAADDAEIDRMAEEIRKEREGAGAEGAATKDAAFDAASEAASRTEADTAAAAQTERELLADGVKPSVIQKAKNKAAGDPEKERKYLWWIMSARRGDGWRTGSLGAIGQGDRYLTREKLKELGLSWE